MHSAFPSLHNTLRNFCLSLDQFHKKAHRKNKMNSHHTLPRAHTTGKRHFGDLPGLSPSRIEVSYKICTHNTVVCPRGPRKKKHRTSLQAAVTHSLQHRFRSRALKEVLPYSRFRNPRAKLTHAHTPGRVSCASDFGTLRGIFLPAPSFLPLDGLVARSPYISKCSNRSISPRTGPGRSLPHDRAITSILRAPLRRLVSFSQR